MKPIKFENVQFGVDCVNRTKNSEEKTWHPGCSERFCYPASKQTGWISGG